MVKPTSTRNADALALFRHRNNLLDTLRVNSLSQFPERSRTFFLEKCCNTIANAITGSSVWAGDIDRENGRLLIFTCIPPASEPVAECQKNFANLLQERFTSSLDTFTDPFALVLNPPRESKNTTAGRHCLVWPVNFGQNHFGFIVLHYRRKIRLGLLQEEFIASVVDDIALAIFSQETDRKLKMATDFSREIVDTIQDLVVTISPGGTILSINPRAEQVTGFKESEVVGKYWVDVLTTIHNRSGFQQHFSEMLKGTKNKINFRTSLLTKDGRECLISWHGSIRQDIDSGHIGLVMLGIDETESRAADHQLNMLTARWEKIFIAIQDPVLVVNNESIILEANPATFAAAQKSRHEVIGRKVCDILHGHHHDHSSICPLEQFIGYHKTHILETELHGLHGTYMLTISPLFEENREIHATLLVARNLTQEEVVRAEAIRAAQLAALGELAAGVAHEINNPINGIINYAQILLDEPDDPYFAENLGKIINEGKRIAAIVVNLLDFARGGEERLAPADLGKIVTDSLQLVAHLFKKDGIDCRVDIATTLPLLHCNEQQLRQVLLNLLSNARYALNRRYPQPCPEKRLEITASLDEESAPPTIIISITDYGTGIPPELVDRIFDPFFSTKPKGEGTGLGLSISHGLVHDQGGQIRVQSKIGEWSRFTIHLPIQEGLMICGKNPISPSVC
jgi:PAS domain S-box-containing protein